MYPEHMVLTYSDNLLGTAPIYAFFRLLTFSRESSFQLWFMVLLLANFACAYGCLKYLLRSKRGAVVGALLFAVSIGLISQLGHAQTFPRFPMPLTIWALMLFANSHKPKHFLFACLGLVYQFYCAIYLGFFLSVPFVLILLYTIFQKRKELMEHLNSWRWVLQIVMSGAISMVLLVLLMYPYYSRAQ
ncbi:unnamed protein product, partial [Chrysoparadoxa australica]